MLIYNNGKLLELGPLAGMLREGEALADNPIFVLPMQVLYQLAKATDTTVTGNTITNAAGDVIISAANAVDVTISGAAAQTELDAINTKVSGILDAVYPVGSIYMSVVSTNPATLFGGTWERLKDRFLLGAGDTYTAGATGGSATQSLTADNNGPHTHLTVLNAGGSGDGWGPSGAYAAGNFNTATSSQGSGTPFSIMPPYLVVYMWQRTA